MNEPRHRLDALGITLPAPPAPVANYVPWVFAGSLLFISGQLSIGSDGDITGTLGGDIDATNARAGARLCGLNLVSQINAATNGDLRNVRRIVKLAGYLRAQPGFGGLPAIMDGCSEVLIAIFGTAGNHTRTVVGVQDLPRNCVAEVDAIVEVEAKIDG